MQNIRHFWSSIRPNGPKRPYQLDRLELRVCDFISDINLLLAVTALLELRIINLFENIDDLDPLVASKYSMKELQSICDINELKAAKNSLNSELIHWRDGRTIICKEWINDLFDDISTIAKKMDISDVIEPIQKVLFEGNKSMKWISEFNKGSSIEEIMKYEIDTMIKAEELYI